MDKTGIYFIYDGDCPLCRSVAHALCFQKVHGTLYMINARQDKTHPLMTDITQRKLDLDKGMVIYANNHFYHGKEALKFMAKYGQARTAFMFFCKGFFWSDTVSSVIYPWMRAIRNWLLRRRNIAYLNNLSEPQRETRKKS